MSEPVRALAGLGADRCSDAPVRVPDGSQLSGAVLQSGGCLVMVIDVTGRVLRWNRACEELTGVAADDVDDCWDLLRRLGPPGEADDLGPALAALVEGRTRSAGTVGHWRGRTGRRHLLAWSHVRASVGATPAVICTGVEITDGGALRRALEASEGSRLLAERVTAAQARVLELVARDTPLAEVQASALEVVETELPGTLTLLVEGGPLRACVIAAPSVPETVGDPCPTSLGACLERLAGTPSSSAALDDVPGLPDAVLAAAARCGARQLWVAPVLVAGAGRWAHVVVLSDRPPSGEREPAVVRSAARMLAIAAERDGSHRALAHQARHDALTGLANRALAVERLERALADRSAGTGGHTVAVLFCDLDRFKTINDSLGHGAGDALLVAVARRLRGVADPEAVVARTGGDEFTVIHQGPGGAAGAMAVGQRLLAAMEQPFQVLGRRVYASMSVGVAVAGRGSSAEALTRDSDAAMYRAKERGGRRVEMFDVFMQVRARERLELETGLHSALAKGELSLVYQPQVRLGTGRVVGAEALLRWNHGGLRVSPSDFVPVAEETGLIVPIGAWVLREACAAAARTAARSRGFRVAVNLSARQLGDPELGGHVARALDVSGLPPSQLCLEVTETALMDDAPAAMTTLRSLHDLGVTFAIDDFGTGWSSLLYLKRLPVSILKIDRTFVRGLGQGGDDEAIVASTIQLGHALGRVVIGEGVETAAQHERLEQLGCRLGQGYRFGRGGRIEDVVPASRIG